ncbi:MAG: PQQ-binding-like beta-propeller repeat protein [Planctomycetales bacterium]|nr:PQQ-binding-like beta-propeller repeat protein [Planctomycetales bacterium]
MKSPPSPHSRSLLFATLWLIACARAATAQPAELDPARQWGNWRGPLQNGSAPHAQPPVKWDARRHVRWKVDLPGEGASTPIVWGERVFVAAAVPTGQAVPRPPLDPRQQTEPPGELYDYVAICLDRDTGKERWRRVLATRAPSEGRHATNTYAGGSPCTDGKQLIVSFGSQGIFALDLDGNPLWARRLGPLRTRRGWGEAVTPALHKGRVVVNWDHEDDSYLYALDAATGATLWRKDRPGEVTSWNTPLCVAANPSASDADRDQPRDVIIVNGTGAARAYDLETGAELWRCGGQTVNAIPTPVQVGNSVVCMSGYRGQTAVCVPLDARGDLTNSSSLAWRYDQDTPYVPSPSLAGQTLFFTKVNDAILTGLNAETGEVQHEPRRLPSLGTVYASPLVADGRLYIADRDGMTVVLDAVSLEVLAVNELPAGVDASPVAVGEQLLLRTRNAVYCLETEKAE